MKCFLQSKKLYQAVSGGLTFWSALHVLAWVLSVYSKLQPKGGQRPLFTSFFSKPDFKSFLCFLAASNPNRSLKLRDLKSVSSTLNTQENQGKSLEVLNQNERSTMWKKQKKPTSKLKEEGKEVTRELLNTYWRQKDVRMLQDIWAAQQYSRQLVSDQSHRTNLWLVSLIYQD